MTNDTTAPPRLPDWFPLDELLPPERRRALEEHVRALAETILHTREVFQDARRLLHEANSALHDVDGQLYDAVSRYTSLNELYLLLGMFSEVVSPDNRGEELDRRIARLDAELAKVPGLGR